MPTAKELFDEAFAKPRSPRSEAYKLGVLRKLRIKVDGIKCECPYAEGTAEAGIQEQDWVKVSSCLMATYRLAEVGSTGLPL